MPVGFVLGRDLEKSLPGVALLVSQGESSKTVSLRDVFSDRMAFVTMHPTFALFKVNRIGGQIPMDHRMTPGMKIQPFLAD